MHNIYISEPRLEPKEFGSWAWILQAIGHNNLLAIVLWFSTFAFNIQDVSSSKSLLKKLRTNPSDTSLVKVGQHVLSSSNRSRKLALT